MKDTIDDHRKEVALFRYGLISEALHLPPDEAARHLKRQSRRELAIPGSARRTVAVTTMRTWIRAWRRSGFDGLMPQRGQSLGHRRSAAGQPSDRPSAAMAAHPRARRPERRTHP